MLDAALHPQAHGLASQIASAQDRYLRTQGNLMVDAHTPSVLCYITQVTEWFTGYPEHVTQPFPT